ncbi:MAG: hypothetical protein GC149_05370 [Gammaproteobacteria bacterium]|nr:hypothetical protein [Gammaproteobacteria bacterium]
MTVTPGASLDSAIAGINRGLDNARKVATEINKDASNSAAQTSTTASNTTTNSGSSRIGGAIDVKA